MAEDGSILPNDGESVGEFEVRGPWITGSYYGDPTPDRFHDGWLRTGDIGSLDAHGFMQISDRTKDVIKSGGEWISSVELENEVMAHPGVVEAAVIAVPDERWSERPLVAVVLEEGADHSADDLVAFLDGRVSKWWLPERWSFIEEVPKTSVGKFDKKVLRSRYAEGGLDVIEVDPPALPLTAVALDPIGHRRPAGRHRRGAGRPGPGPAPGGLRRGAGRGRARPGADRRGEARHPGPPLGGEGREPPERPDVVGRAVRRGSVGPRPCPVGPQSAAGSARPLRASMSWRSRP